MKTKFNSNFLRLRELTLDDTSKLFEIYSDIESMRFRGSKTMVTIIDAEEFVKNRIIIENNITTIRKGVELIQVPELIGSVMIRSSIDVSNKCEIGYSIGRNYWGKGYGSQIVSMLVNELSISNRINVISAWCVKENVASIKILEKIGFKKVQQSIHPKSILYEKYL